MCQAWREVDEEDFPYFCPYKQNLPNSYSETFAKLEARLNWIFLHKGWLSHWDSCVYFVFFCSNIVVRRYLKLRISSWRKVIAAEAFLIQVKLIYVEKTVIKLFHSNLDLWIFIISRKIFYVPQLGLRNYIISKLHFLCNLCDTVELNIVFIAYIIVLFHIDIS